MPYREPDAARTVDQLAASEAANIDEAAVLGSMRSGPQLQILRAFIAILIFFSVLSGCTLGGAIIGGLGSRFLDELSGLIVGFVVGIVGGITSAVLFLTRDPRSA